MSQAATAQAEKDEENEKDEKPPLLDAKGIRRLSAWHFVLIAALLFGIYSIWGELLPDGNAASENASGTPAPTPDYGEADLVERGAKLAARWKAKGDPVTIYLLSVSPDSSKEVDAHQGGTPSDTFRAAMLKDLNRVLRDPKLAESAPKDLAARIGDPTKLPKAGEELRRFNRAVFAASYPDSFVAAASPVTEKKRMNRETVLLLAVFLFGALGGAISAAWGSTSFIGGRKMQASWVAWNMMRAPIGAGLAVLFYTVVRGSVTSDSDGEGINVFFVVGTAGMVGLFTRGALNQLQGQFEKLPQPTGDREGREQSQSNAGGATRKPPLPEIDAIDPTSLAKTAASVRITGKGFAKDASVLLGEAKQVTTEVKANQITITIDTANRVAGKKKLVVVNPDGADGVRSNEKELTIE
jgi:hypothetical protein